MLTTLTRFLLAHQLEPFTFLPSPDFCPNYDATKLGLYIHIPFCLSLCDFCPYYKTIYNESTARHFVDALLLEIELVAQRLGPEKMKITNLYFGGGSPALLVHSIRKIMRKIQETFILTGNVGLELHPRDATEPILSELKNAGITMISLGAQTFQPKLLATLGRTEEPPIEALRLISKYAFESLDVDLIFGIPGQSEKDIDTDFRIAVETGATQVSTYPFIDFSYAKNRQKPLGRQAKKKMLESLLRCSEELSFARTSVWTFGKKNAPRYSSITRDTFIGFGPSATSLGAMDFKINTFSVEEYIKTVGEGSIPTALRLHFSPKSRGAYWLFWNCYNGSISSTSYEDLFGRDIEKDFGSYLTLATTLGWLTQKTGRNKTWVLTEKGSYLFHLIEQKYTHQYIDKTWRASFANPWPERIVLH